MRAPFIIPAPLGLVLSAPFSSLAVYLSKLFPEMGATLKIIGVDLTEVRYTQMALMNSVVIGAVSGVLFYFAAVKYHASPGVILWGPIAAGFILLVLYLTYLMLVPAWVLRTRAQQIEAQLLFAVRHLVVQTSAGVPLFDAIYSASSGYGEVSAEFARIATEVNGGRDLSDSLESSAVNSPSPYYRRIAWQIANSARSGYAVADILSDLLDYLNYDQQTKMKKFGSELNIISVFYLSTCIVMPTFGLIFTIIVSSFSLINPNEQLLGMLIILMVFFNLIFLGMIRSRRPLGII